MPVSERQLAAFADTHAWRIPFDTTPRYFAGPGDGRHVTHGLAAAGWTRTSDPLSPEIVLTSPDRRHHLQFDPQSATLAWWRLRAEPADAKPWFAEFGERVPAEILSAFTDALIAPPPTEQADPFRTLESSGWLIDAGDVAASPDALCHVELQTDRIHGGTPHWRVEAVEQCPGTLGERIWHASFDGHTPAHLVDAFITALADPAPLQRGMYEGTVRRSAVQKRRSHPLTRQQVLDAHTTRLDALRAQARAARRRQQPVTASAPSPPTSATAPLRR
ncbi:hypothetical protein HOK021_66220 [Streptomyces hygroscopicus]|nr:DUF317 domain-containing protein [Streptomyces hygroscopicus]BDH15443.1 hypothetical protein HOK021_66220 [Streptomyces hygroscopicus]